MITMKPVTAEEVRRFLLEHLDSRLREICLNPDDVTDDCDLLELGLVDSTGILEMICAVEDRFGIVVDFEGLDVNNLTIIGPFCKYVETRTAENGY